MCIHECVNEYHKSQICSYAKENCPVNYRILKLFIYLSVSSFNPCGDGTELRCFLRTVRIEIRLHITRSPIFCLHCPQSCYIPCLKNLKMVFAVLYDLRKFIPLVKHCNSYSAVRDHGFILRRV